MRRCAVSGGGRAQSLLRGSLLRRYALYQLPEVVLGALLLVGLVRFEIISRPLGFALFAVWVLMQAAFYPFIARSYEPSSGSPADALLGVACVVTARVSPEVAGKVRIGPEFWNARLEPGSVAAEVGSEVCVEAVDGLTLRVRAVGSKARSSSS